MVNKSGWHFKTKMFLLKSQHQLDMLSFAQKKEQGKWR
jgi:hypothetical protein